MAIVESFADPEIGGIEAEANDAAAATEAEDGGDVWSCDCWKTRDRRAILFNREDSIKEKKKARITSTFEA